MIILPAVIDITIEESEIIEVDIQEEDPLDVDLDPSYVIPLIPENYCRFEWDGTRLRFS